MVKPVTFDSEHSMIAASIALHDEPFTCIVKIKRSSSGVQPPVCPFNVRIFEKI